MSNLNDMVKTLRQETGAPLLQCRDALQATNCDMAAAKVYLRESGLQFLEKRKVVGGKPYGVLAKTTDVTSHYDDTIKRALHTAEMKTYNDGEVVFTTTISIWKNDGTYEFYTETSINCA